jgi:hypothetical protein
MEIPVLRCSSGSPLIALSSETELGFSNASLIPIKSLFPEYLYKQVQLYVTRISPGNDVFAENL